MIVDNSKSVIILKVSMTKQLNAWETSKRVNNPSWKIYVNHFAEAITTCMENYKQPSLWNAPKCFILHVSTNDLDSNETAESITNTIIDLATSLKNDEHDLSISNIILRMYNTNLNVKRCLVNSILAEICKKTYILLTIPEK